MQEEVLLSYSEQVCPIIYESKIAPREVDLIFKHLITQTIHMITQQEAGEDNEDEISEEDHEGSVNSGEEAETREEIERRIIQKTVEFKEFIAKLREYVLTRVSKMHRN